ncbi:MAG: glycosyltransferase family 1 protein [Cognatishimia sp.]|uniref:glycosyltransferase family 4 protein n=1 Tax=Cognatishimia sp. TaxID=2211648 RepID=UPI003B8DCF52
MDLPSTQLESSHRPLRLAIFSGVYDYIVDGVSVTLNRLVDQLERDGVEVLVFAPTAKQSAFDHAGTLVSVPSIPMPGRREYRASIGLGRSAKKRLDAFQPTLIHIAAPDILGWRALSYARAHNLPVLASYHTRYETYFDYYGAGFALSLASRYLRSFYSKADRLCAPTQAMADDIEQAGYGRDIVVWGRGVNPDLFSPVKRSTEWRQELGIGSDEIVVLFVSRLVREKNLDVLVDALNGLKERGLAFRTVIVGDGPESTSLKARLPEAIFTGFLGGEDLACAYASSDIFFFASLTETFGNVTLEAMASALPAVCADATGSRSLVEPGVTGFLEPADNVDAMIGRLSELVQHSDLRRKMGEAALARSAAFTQAAAYRQVRNVYASLLETH